MMQISKKLLETFLHICCQNSDVIISSSGFQNGTVYSDFFTTSGLVGGLKNDFNATLVSRISVQARISVQGGILTKKQ